VKNVANVMRDVRQMPSQTNNGTNAIAYQIFEHVLGLAFELQPKRRRFGLRGATHGERR